MMTYSKLVPGIVLLVAFVVSPSGTRGDSVSIGLALDGGPILTVVPTTSLSGYASFVGTFGGFTFNSVSGTGSPILAEPTFESTSLNVLSSGGTHTLNVFITQSGLSSPTGVNSFLSSFNSQAFSSSGIASVVERTFIDPLNTLYGGNPLASFVFTGAGSNSSVNGTPFLAFPYSETVEYTINTTGAGSVNDTIDINAATPVPEPSTLLLSVLGIGGLFLAKRRALGA